MGITTDWFGGHVTVDEKNGYTQPLVRIAKTEVDVYLGNDAHKASLIHFQIAKGIITPEQAQGIKWHGGIMNVRGDAGVILSGKGPVWLMGHLIHLFHPTRWVATFDPRLGAVVVESHITAPSSFDVINMGCFMPDLNRLQMVLECEAEEWLEQQAQS